MGPGTVAGGQSGLGLTPGSPQGLGEALLLPPFCYLSPCCEKEDLLRMLVPRACHPSFSSPLGLGAPVMIRPVACGWSGKNVSSCTVCLSSARSLAGK